MLDDKPIARYVLGFFSRLLTRLTRWWGGKVLEARIQDERSDQRSEAEEAVAKVVYETQVAPDCVSATVLLGGPAIMVEHDGAKEGFVHKTYAQAADKAIEWLNEREGRHIRQGKTSKINRRSRRALQKRRRADKRRNGT